MRRFLWDNGLSIALFGLFVLAMLGQAVAGWLAFNQDLGMHGAAPIGAWAYLGSGHFLSAVFENWESEFLQMAVYVLLTVFLVQRGSPESRDPDHPEDELEPPSAGLQDPMAKRPVRVRRPVSWLYAHSLSLALICLFLLSFAGHLVACTGRLNEEARRHGMPEKTVGQTLAEAEFWYESFQNWQSEFLSIGVLVVLGIFLRERGSPESKPVGAPHTLTGR